MKVFFVDQTSLLEESFIFVLEAIAKQKEDVHFIFDSMFEKNIERFRSLDDDKYFVLQTLYLYFKRSESYEIIDTDDFCSDEKLYPVLEKLKDHEVIVVSQRSSTFKLFSDIKKEGISYYSVLNGKLSNKKIAKKNANAPFYIQNDHYINIVDTSNLKYVFSPKYGYLKLFKQHVSAGGEGTCYPSYHNLYCKVFNEKHLTYVNYKKLQYMLELGIENEYLAWPKDILYSNGDFVGYAMNFVKGAKSLTQLKDDGFAQYAHPLLRAKICLSFLKNIKYLHDRNILVCDLKDDNVLVKNENEVYIIDCGSFQVADFACDVVTKGWTDKEYHKDDLTTQLRTLDEEYYPINRLIFELMVLKNPFYSPNNLEVDSENSADFEFPLDISEIGKDSPMYLKLWAILSENIRSYFYYYFKNPDNRKIIYIDEWIQEFELYIKSLEE